MESPEKGLPLLLVDASVLPDVFSKVLEAKEYLQTGHAATAAEAARMAGISRSAFYKYKDAVFPYDAERSGSILTVHLILRDRPGVLSSVLSAFAAAGRTFSPSIRTSPPAVRLPYPYPPVPIGWTGR